MTEQAGMQERTITIERVLNAPRELVWRVWTDPDEVTKWWGPAEFTTPRETIEFDLRPGGISRLTMVGPDGQEYPNEGRFGIVQAPERLSFGGIVDDHPMMTSAETMIEFIALDDTHTKVIVTARMVCVEQLIDMATLGWGSQIDKLERLLAA